MLSDLSHALNIYRNLRINGINTTAIESAIQYSALRQTGKNIILRLNEGQALNERVSQLFNTKTYFCYTTGNEDYKKEFNPKSFIYYYAQSGNISKN